MASRSRVRERLMEVRASNPLKRSNSCNIWSGASMYGVRRRLSLAASSFSQGESTASNVAIAACHFCSASSLHSVGSPHPRKHSTNLSFTTLCVCRRSETSWPLMLQSCASTLLSGPLLGTMRTLSTSSVITLTQMISRNLLARLLANSSTYGPSCQSPSALKTQLGSSPAKSSTAARHLARRPRLAASFALTFGSVSFQTRTPLSHCWATRLMAPPHTVSSCRMRCSGYLLVTTCPSARQSTSSPDFRWSKNSRASVQLRLPLSCSSPGLRGSRAAFAASTSAPSVSRRETEEFCQKLSSSSGVSIRVHCSSRQQLSASSTTFPKPTHLTTARRDVSKSLRSSPVSGGSFVAHSLSSRRSGQ
mmetsp:Transcript_8816/g.27104  ORF Transcript_8816/g.27104 Transcript_8816/m.27104 type:complete len:363 (+) Transcript_8816:2313-3401(+)